MHASNLRDGTKCTLLPEYSWGYNHLVRLIEFGDKKQLLASPYANDTGIDWDEVKMSTFMLMEALKENNIIGATGNDPSKLSEEQRSALVKQIAEIHVSQPVSVFTMLDGIRT